MKPLSLESHGNPVCPKCNGPKHSYSSQCRKCDARSRNWRHYSRDRTEQLFARMIEAGNKLTEMNCRKFGWRGMHEDFYAWRTAYLAERGLEPAKVIGEAGRTRIVDYPVIPARIEAKREPEPPLLPPVGKFAPLATEHFRAWRRILTLKGGHEATHPERRLHRSKVYATTSVDLPHRCAWGVSDGV